MRLWLFACLSLCLLLVPKVRAQDLPVKAGSDLAVLAPETNPRKMLYEYLLAQSKKAFDARRATVAGLKTPEEIQKRQRELRARFIEALGGFPEKTNLNAKVVGKITGEGYSIEKVVYESRPNHHVTANLYLPVGKPPFPAVLMPIGHSGNGKASDYTQRAAILLAKNGIAAFPYDPISQGERRQILDTLGKPAIASITSEHTLIGVGALLTGGSTATYRIWDGIRGLDYLTSRPDIDGKRLGCTGCSGGGTLTSYLMALDDRILAAAPSCYLTTLERLFATIGPQDAEQNITGQVAFGLDHADYLTLRAPKPTLICAATRDFFDIQGTWTTFREAKQVYGKLGYPERVDLMESDSGHGFPRSHREAMVRFMRRWLVEKDQAVTEPMISIHADKDLWCTRTGQVLDDLKGKSTFDLNAERARNLAHARGKQADRKEALLKEVTRLIGATPLPKAKREDVEIIKREGYTIGKCYFAVEPGIIVPALSYVPAKEEGPLVVYLHGLGKGAEAGTGGQLEKLVKIGRRVLALDLRGMGETAPGVPSAKGTNFFGVDFKETYVALHLNRPLLGQRVQDLRAILAGLQKDHPEGFELIAVGSAGPVALHAAALEPMIKQLTLERSVITWLAVAVTPANIDQLTNVVPGALEVYDLPDLAATLAPRRLTIREPVDPAGKIVTQKALAEAYVSSKAAYARLKAEKNLELIAAKPDSELGSP